MNIAGTLLNAGTRDSRSIAPGSALPRRNRHLISLVSTTHVKTKERLARNLTSMCVGQVQLSVALRVLFAAGGTVAASRKVREHSESQHCSFLQCGELGQPLLSVRTVRG
jgi:hypothetical protein